MRRRAKALFWSVTHCRELPVEAGGEQIGRPAASRLGGQWRAPVQAGGKQISRLGDWGRAPV
jgi:hypothetical protein